MKPAIDERERVPHFAGLTRPGVDVTNSSVIVFSTVHCCASGTVSCPLSNFVRFLKSEKI